MSSALERSTTRDCELKRSRDCIIAAEAEKGARKRRKNDAVSKDFFLRTTSDWKREEDGFDDCDDFDDFDDDDDERFPRDERDGVDDDDDEEEEEEEEGVVVVCVERWRRLVFSLLNLKTSKTDGEKEKPLRLLKRQIKIDEDIGELHKAAYRYRCVYYKSRKNRLVHECVKMCEDLKRSSALACERFPKLCKSRILAANNCLNDVAKRQYRTIEDAEEVEYREDATLSATAQLVIPRNQNAEWMSSHKNIFSCVKFDKTGRFIACAGTGGTLSVHKTSDVNIYPYGGDTIQLPASIYAPTYKKFLRHPIDSAIWVREGIIATVSERSDEITFHDIEGRAQPSSREQSSASHPSQQQDTYTSATQSLIAQITSDGTSRSGLLSLASCDDGNRIFASNRNGLVLSFDPRQKSDPRRPCSQFSAPLRSVLNCVNVTGDGQLICAGTSCGKVVLWDARKTVSNWELGKIGNGIKNNDALCSWNISNLFTKIHGATFSDNSQVYWTDFDPKDTSRIAFHCSNGRTGVIDMKRICSQGKSLITHAHCPPSPWDAEEDNDAARNYSGRRTCSWSNDGQKLILPNVYDSGISVLDVAANDPHSYQWIDGLDLDYENDDVKEKQKADSSDTYGKSKGLGKIGNWHKPIEVPLKNLDGHAQERILNCVAVHPTCDFEYVAGGENTVSYFRFRKWSRR
jgi:hypothetical protein